MSEETCVQAPEPTWRQYAALWLRMKAASAQAASEATGWANPAHTLPDRLERLADELDADEQASPPGYEPWEVPVVNKFGDALRPEFQSFASAMHRSVFRVLKTGEGPQGDAATSPNVLSRQSPVEADTQRSTRNTGPCAGCDLENGCPEYCYCGQPPLGPVVAASPSDTPKTGSQNGEVTVVPLVLRATGRRIPDLTDREHVCGYQSQVKANSTPSDTSQGVSEAICQSCHGSGEGKCMTWGHGPDDYEVDCPCKDCDGTGIKRDPNSWRQALEFAASTMSRNWPERCQEIVRRARAALRSEPGAPTGEAK